MGVWAIQIQTQGTFPEIEFKLGQDKAFTSIWIFGKLYAYIYIYIYTHTHTQTNIYIYIYTKPSRIFWPRLSRLNGLGFDPLDKIFGPKIK